MKAVKMINSTVLASRRIKPFPAAASQKLTFSTNAAENQKKTLDDKDIQITPFSKLTVVSKYLVECSRELTGESRWRVRTELFPSLEKFFGKPPIMVVTGKEGTTYCIPIPGVSVIETDGELKVCEHTGTLSVYAYRHSSKVGGGISYVYMVYLPAGFTIDDLTIDHDNGLMMVFVPNQKKAELVSKEEVGQQGKEFDK